MIYRILNLFVQFLDAFALISLAAIGLAIIFGIMRVINLAHGEFIMIGAYTTTLSYHAGIPLVVGIVLGSLATGVFGVIVERTVVRRLYGRLLDSMLATWGISLILTQGVRIVFGNSLDQIGTPLGAISYGQYSFSTYRVMLAGVSVVVLAAVYWVFMYTEWGMRARATIQNEEMARSLGTDTERMYMLTFALGSALAGLTGALYAPTVTIVPTLGEAFLFDAFMGVIVGGTSVLLGTLLSGGALGFVNAFFANTVGNLFGDIAMLLAAILVIRFLPEGLSGAVERYREQRRSSGGDDQ